METIGIGNNRNTLRVRGFKKGGFTRPSFSFLSCALALSLFPSFLLSLLSSLFSSSLPSLLHLHPALTLLVVPLLWSVVLLSTLSRPSAFSSL